MKKLLSAIAGLALCLSACGRGGPQVKQHDDTPTTGHVTIAVDEVAMPIVRSTIATFEDVYTNAKVDVAPVPQEVGFQLLTRDSVRLVIGSRKLNAAEKEIYKKLKIEPDEYEYAVDAVAVILNNANTDSLFTLDQLKGILSGQTTTWPGKAGIKIVPVLDNGSGANASFLKEALHLSDSLPKSVYATGSTEKVVDYVANTPGAIGFIGVGYISDKDSPSAVGFNKSIRVASISDAQVADASNSYKPYAAYLQLKKYPLRRMLYIVSGEAHSGLGTGFAAWALSDKGQRIVLKSGLLPATAPTRIVNVNKSSDFGQ